MPAVTMQTVTIPATFVCSTVKKPCEHSVEIVDRLRCESVVEAAVRMACYSDVSADSWQFAWHCTTSLGL